MMFLPKNLENLAHPPVRQNLSYAIYKNKRKELIMIFSTIIGLLFSWIAMTASVHAQSNEIKISKLVLDKKQKEVFDSRDSSVVIYIDTLIMKDRSSLQFYGKKEVTITVKLAEKGGRGIITGVAGKNNESNVYSAFVFHQLRALNNVAK